MSPMTSRPCLDDDRNSPCSSPQMQHRVGNVFHLLARREVSPRTKCCPKRQWGKAPKHIHVSGVKGDAVRDARRGLYSWVETESLRHLSGEYCALVTSPRSTIAAAFSPDGKRLASTHGDHTVKIIDGQSGHCLKVFSGHRRTPWVVRFHPWHPAVLASGSLDQEVRLWDANTSECIGSHNFYRPIASIAFHAEGELLAVASGHKLYLWHYNQRGEAPSPTMVLKTRRSLRAIHFHPHGAPFLLTAEVNDLDSSDSSVDRATSLGCLHYPPPAVYMANVHSSDCHSLAAELPLMPLPFLCPISFARDDSSEDSQVQNRVGGANRIQAVSSASMQFQVDANLTEQNDHSASTIEMSPVPNTYDEMPDIITNYPPSAMQSSIHDTPVDTGLPAEVRHVEDYQHSCSADQDMSDFQSLVIPESISTTSDPTGFKEHGNLPTRHDSIHHKYPSCNYGLDSTVSTSKSLKYDPELPQTSFPNNMNGSVVPESSSSGDHSLHTHFVSAPEVGPHPVLYNNPRERVNTVPIISRIESELSVSLAATAAAELPCTVKLRVWLHDIEHTCAPLSVERCRLTIPHAVLCSEMGTHFSPCGKYLAACVACALPEMESDPGLVSYYNQDAMGSPTSPTRHPISSRQIIYELRIYSLEEPTFGSVLVSRAIRAAHCLTSIQFSPTSEHILLAYGRRHCSLLKSIVINGEASVPIYTVLEVYRVSDLELVSVLPSAEDEVNVACFNPLAGGGLVYGTKEGKLRSLQYDRAHCNGNAGSSFFAEANILEIPTYALEC